MNWQSILQKRPIGLSKGPKPLLDSPWAIKLIVFLLMIMKMYADPISSGKVLPLLIQNKPQILLLLKILAILSSSRQASIKHVVLS